MTGEGKVAEKPSGAWSAEETVLFMLDRVRQGDFYVLVPDNETRRATDELRILWAAGGTLPFSFGRSGELIKRVRCRCHGGKAGAESLASDVQELV